MSAQLYHSYFHTQIGWVAVSAGEDGIYKIEFHDKEPLALKNQQNAMTLKCVVQLEEYFAGRRQLFTLPLKPAGSYFQRRVWQKLQEIPHGKTTTYGELAHQLGDPKKVRAVGQANGSNPIAIIIPCHRVIGQKGMLIGYGGGLWRKEWLLQHEGALLI